MPYLFPCPPVNIESLLSIMPFHLKELLKFVVISILSRGNKHRNLEGKITVYLVNQINSAIFYCIINSNAF